MKRVSAQLEGAAAPPPPLKYSIPQTKLCSVYYAIVESHLRYANEIWGSIPKTKLYALQSLQCRVRTIIENARLNYSWLCDWLSIQNIIRFDRSVLAYKAINKLSPENLEVNFNKDLRNEIMQQGIVKIYKFPGLIHVFFI